MDRISFSSIWVIQMPALGITLTTTKVYTLLRPDFENGWCLTMSHSMVVCKILDGTSMDKCLKHILIQLYVYVKILLIKS